MLVSVSVKWQGDAFLKVAHGKARASLEAGCIMLRDQVRANLVLNIGGITHSLPGEYPYLISGQLRRSIYYKIDDFRLTGEVGTDSLVGLWLEKGVSGGRVILAKGLGYLTWLDQQGNRHFARRVIQGSIRPRHFLRNSLAEASPSLAQVLVRPWNI